MTVWQALNRRHRPTLFLVALGVFLLWWAGDQGYFNQMVPEWLLALVAAGLWGIGREIYEWLPWTPSQAEAPEMGAQEGAGSA